MSNGHVIPFKDMLKCSICQDMIKDARSLPCGHTFCKDCLARSADATYLRGSINCSECKKISQLPNGGADGFPVAYRINSIVTEIKSNDSETSSDTQASSSQSRRSQPPHLRRSPDTSTTSRSLMEDLDDAKRRAQARANQSTTSRSLMEDVDDAKRRAQARANQIQVFVRQINGHNLTLAINANDTVGDLRREIKTRTHIDQSQQRLTFSGRNLDDKTRSLSSYGIVNLSNIDMNVRLRGGSQ